MTVSLRCDHAFFLEKLAIIKCCLWLPESVARHKGSQGGKKSMDRASGSGVFARDPDALLDLIELETTDALMEQEENKAICKACIQYLDAHFEWADDLSQDDLCSKTQMLSYCQEHLDKWQMNTLQKQIDQAVTDTRAKTAWRIEGTLREFPKFEPVNVWFHYPVHRLDDTGCLHDIQPEDERPPWKKGAESNKKSAKDRKEERRKALEAALENSNFGENPSVDDVAGYLGVSKRTARDRINEHGGYVIEGGIVRKKAEKQREGKTENKTSPHKAKMEGKTENKTSPHKAKMEGNTEKQSFPHRKTEGGEH